MRPVAGFGAASAGLDIEEAVVGVCGLVEHATEFQRFDALADRLGFGFDGLQCGLIALVAAHLVQFGTVGKLLCECIQYDHHVVE